MNSDNSKLYEVFLAFLSFVALTLILCVELTKDKKEITQDKKEITQDKEEITQDKEEIIQLCQKNIFDEDNSKVFFIRNVVPKYKDFYFKYSVVRENIKLKNLFIKCELNNNQSEFEEDLKKIKIELEYFNP